MKFMNMLMDMQHEHVKSWIQTLKTRRTSMPENTRGKIYALYTVSVLRTQQQK